MALNSCSNLTNCSVSLLRSPLGYAVGSLRAVEESAIHSAALANLALGSLGFYWNYVVAKTFYRSREKLANNGAGRLMGCIAVTDCGFCAGRLGVGVRLGAAWLAGTDPLLTPRQCLLWGTGLSLFCVSASIVLFFGLSVDRFRRASKKLFQEPKFYVRFWLAAAGAFGAYAVFLLSRYFPDDEAVACVSENTFFTVGYASRKLPVSGSFTWATIFVYLASYLRIALLQKQVAGTSTGQYSQSEKQMRDTGRSVLWITGVYSVCWVAVISVDLSDLLFGISKLSGTDRLKASALQNLFMLVNYSSSYLVYRFRFAAFREELKKTGHTVVVVSHQVSNNRNSRNAA